MARTKGTPTHVELTTIAHVCSTVVPYESRQLVVYAGGNRSPTLRVKPMRVKMNTVISTGRGPQCGQDATLRIICDY